MRVHDCEQRSAEWFRLRLGRPTGSEFSKIVTAQKCELSKQASSYMDYLLAEWALGPQERPETQWMERGTDLEDEAVRSYQFERDLETYKVGFVTNDEGTVGVSPDRMVGADGILEIKCPKPETHVGYMLRRTVSIDYKVQVQGQLWICERDWCDIQSYCPGLPTTIIRVERDEAYIEKLSAAVLAFSAELENYKIILASEYGLKAWEPPTQGGNATAFGLSDDDVDAIVRSKFNG